MHDVMTGGQTMMITMRRMLHQSEPDRAQALPGEGRKAQHRTAVHKVWEASEVGGVGEAGEAQAEGLGLGVRLHCIARRVVATGRILTNPVTKRPLIRCKPHLHSPRQRQLLCGQ